MCKFYMNRLANTILAIFLLLLQLLPIVIVESKVEPKWVHQNASPWLRNVANSKPRPRRCMSRPWICREGRHPPTARMRCCRNQCVDVSSDDTHCGSCGLRCPFTWLCCRGICININISPFNCGKSGNRCPRTPCLYGLCGYAQPPPPWPRPSQPPRPPRPWPPHIPRHTSRPWPETNPPQPRPPPAGICPTGSIQPPEGNRPPQPPT